MEPIVIVGLVSFVALLVVVMSLAPPRRKPHRFGREREAMEANLAMQADIEESDIDQMIAARNDIRRRRGAPEIGDDLLAELQPELDRAQRRDRER